MQGAEHRVQIEDGDAHLLQIRDLFADAVEGAAVKIHGPVLALTHRKQILVPVPVHPAAARVVHGLGGRAEKAVRKDLVDRGAVHPGRRLPRGIVQRDAEGVQAALAHMALAAQVVLRRAVAPGMAVLVVDDEVVPVDAGLRGHCDGDLPYPVAVEGHRVGALLVHPGAQDHVGRVIADQAKADVAAGRRGARGLTVVGAVAVVTEHDGILIS